MGIMQKIAKKGDNKEKFIPFFRQLCPLASAIILSKGGGALRVVVYADVLFCVNFSIDLILLVLSGWALSLKRRPVRVILSSLFGGLFSVITLWLSLSPLYHYAHTLAAALLMCLIAYAPIPPRVFFKLAVAFFGASLLLGGAVSVLYSALASFFDTGELGTTNALVSAHKAEIFLLYALGSAFVFFLAGRFFTRHGSAKSVMLDLEEGGKSVTVSALVDSGNLLSDPFSARPVILVREREVRSVLPPPLFSVLEAGVAEEMPLSLQRKVRLIPAVGIGGKRTLVGYLPDAILLYEKNDEKHKKALDAVLAVCAGDLRDFDGHAAILPAKLLH